MKSYLYVDYANDGSVTAQPGPVLKQVVALEYRDLPKHDAIWGCSCWDMPDGTGRIVVLFGKRYAKWRPKIHVYPSIVAARSAYSQLVYSKLNKYTQMGGSDLISIKLIAQLEAYGNTLMELEPTEPAQIDVEDCSVCQVPHELIARSTFCIDCWVPLAEHDATHPHVYKLTECQGFVRAEPGQTIKRPDEPRPRTPCTDCGRALGKNHVILGHPWVRVCSLCKRISTKYALVHALDCPFGKAIKVEQPQVVAVKQLTDSNRPSRDISGFADDF